MGETKLPGKKSSLLQTIELDTMSLAILTKMIAVQVSTEL